VTENKASRRLCGPKREEGEEGEQGEEGVEGRSRLQNEELHNLYASPNIIRVTK
jgi:hypothetical protein